MTFHRRRRPWTLGWVLRVAGDVVRVREAGGTAEMDVDRADLRQLPAPQLHSGDTVQALWPAGDSYTSVFYEARLLKQEHGQLQVQSTDKHDRRVADVPACMAFFVRGPQRRPRSTRKSNKK